MDLCRLSLCTALIVITGGALQVDGQIPENFLPFGIENGDTALRSATFFDEFFSERITLDTNVGLFGSRFRIIYVNPNGVVSFRWAFTDNNGRGSNFSSVSQNLFGRSIIAPFWDDVNTYRGGDIFYRLISDNNTLVKIQQEISAQYPELGDAYPSLVFLATWDRVSSDIFSSFHRNTFQVYVATNGDWSIVKFSYGDIEWASRFALVGVAAGFAPIHITHPASLNQQALRQLSGTSVFYRIDDDSDLDPVMCPSLNVANGHVIISPSNRSVGSKASYVCDDNFAVSGNEIRVCQRYGTWNGTEPLCDTAIKRPLPECFLPYGSENGDSTVQRQDESSEFIPVDTSVVILGYYGPRQIFVNTNGVILLHGNYPRLRSSSRGSGFDSVGVSPPLIAPFWDNVDITRGGNLTYRQISDNNTLDKIQQEISEQYPELANSRPSLVFLATWENVPPFSSIGSSSDRNTFQVYVASNGTWTVVRFCYGSIEWATNSTLIGVSPGGFYPKNYITHPASLNSQAVQRLNGSSVLYRIDEAPQDFLPYGLIYNDTFLYEGNDISSREISLDTDVILFGTHFRRLFVNTNGVLSFNMSFTSPDGRGSNFSDVISPPIIAPFWDDVSTFDRSIITAPGGDISYRIISDERTFNQVQQEILEHYPVLGGARPSLVFVATWDKVGRFGPPSYSRNSFQVYIATNGTWTVVRFSYGSIQWASYDTLIGIRANARQHHITHPASLHIDALRQLCGSKVFYRIDDYTDIDPLPCPPLQNITHGMVTVPTPPNTNAVALYQCEEGYTLVGDERRTCLINQRWSGKEPTCAMVCNPLRNITNGYVTNPTNPSEGSAASYGCNDDFILVGNETSTCQSDGTWSGDEPRCDPLQVCLLLYNISRGSVMIPTPPTTDSVALYQCEEGYVLVGDERRTCLINQTWSGKEPTCELSPPREVNGFCSHINWRNVPGAHCGDIIGYQLKLIYPSTKREAIRQVDNLGTFYILTEDDVEYKKVETEVQVGVMSSLGLSGVFSESVSLGCKDTVMPTSKPDPSVYFELDGRKYLNDSEISISDVGEGERALLCKTDKEDCCATVPNRFGEFYYPNGIHVPIARVGQTFYRNRGEQLIRLNRRGASLFPTGKYRCEIPDASGVVQSAFITLK